VIDLPVNGISTDISTTTRSNLVFNTTNRDVSDYYEVIKILGEGSMGSVSCVRKKENAVGGSAYRESRRGFFGLYRFSHQRKAPESVIKSANSKLYALKSIILSRVSDDFIEELRNEISILASLDHPNIVKAYEVYETNVNIYLLLQNCSGGDLYSRIPYSEKACAKIASKLMSALSHMHKHNVTHRDIKFENIMFESKDPDAEIKLIDFGLSRRYSPENKYMNDGVGTIYTMAPQVLQGEYTSQADLWSIGVVTYMLLSNTKPFYGKKRRHVVAKILQGNFSFYSKMWRSLSDESKKFVRALLCVDPSRRLTADQALEHRWLDSQFPLSDRVPKESMLGSIHDSIIAYSDMSEFKKMALMVIAHQSSTSEIMELRKAFDAYDVANQGTITFDEFKSAMKKANTQHTDDEIEKLFKSVDIGHDNEIYYLEFLAATLSAHGRINEERLAEAFDRIDSDDKGFISRENLKEILGTDYSKEKVDQYMQEADFLGDNKISFEEFVKFFQADQMQQVRAFRLDESNSASSNSLSVEPENDSSASVPVPEHLLHE